MVNEVKRELKGCIIDLEHLLRLIEIAKNYFPKYDLSITFEDNSKINKVQYDDVKNMDFANKKIVDIDLQCYEISFKPDIESYLYFHSFNTSPYTVRFSSSDYVKFLSMNADVENWVKTIQNKARTRLINLLEHELLISALLTIVFGGFVVIGSILLFGTENALIDILLGSFIGFGFFGGFLGLLAKLQGLIPPTELDIGVNDSKKRRRFWWALITLIILPTIYLILGIVIPLL